MKIDRLDHLVLTVRDMEVTSAFYARVLMREPVTSATGRRSLMFGRQKINLHPPNAPFAPHAFHPTPGSPDVCFVTGTPLDEVVVHFNQLGVAVAEDPVSRAGATGPMTSVYIRDPDSNLIEISMYDDPV